MTHVPIFIVLVIEKKTIHILKTHANIQKYGIKMYGHFIGYIIKYKLCINIYIIGKNLIFIEY